MPNSILDDAISVVTGGLWSAIGTPASTLILGGIQATLPVSTIPNAGEGVLRQGIRIADIELAEILARNTVLTGISRAGAEILVDILGHKIRIPPPGQGQQGVLVRPPSPYRDAFVTYSGSDVLVLLEWPQFNAVKQLFELTTISISSHRVKTPARACGYIGAKGYARGSRTVAGTMVLTKFTLDFLCDFLFAIQKDLSKDSLYAKLDQLPPFNLLLVFSDETGMASYQRLVNVEMITDGTVISSNDMFMEQTISYVAADFTPLLPFDMTALLSSSDPRMAPGKTPHQLLRKDRTPNFVRI